LQTPEWTVPKDGVFYRGVCNIRDTKKGCRIERQPWRSNGSNRAIW
jgi:hypothetical protein